VVAERKITFFDKKMSPAIAGFKILRTFAASKQKRWFERTTMKFKYWAMV
jgi:hypothetical protein